VERIYDMIAVVLLFAVNLLWFTPPANAGVEFGRVRTAGIVLLLLAVVGVLGLTQFRKRSERAISWTRKTLEPRRFIPPRLTRALLSILEQLASALRVLVDARELAVTVGWSAMVWGAIGLANWLVFRAFGLPFGVTETVFVLGWSLVGSLVPTPGGAAGAFHAATAAGLISLGVQRDTAAAISIVLHIVDFGPALIFGVYYILRGDINLSRLRAKTSSESVEHAVEDDPIAPAEVFAQTEMKTAAVQD